MKSKFKVGDILLDKIAPTSRVLIAKETDEGYLCLFLDGYMEGKTVKVKHLFNYRKIGRMNENGRKET